MSVAFRSFLGRSGELSHLLQRRREASAGRGGLVLVSGDAGAGKSRLLAEFRGSLDSARLHVAVAQCSESPDRPYSAVLDAISLLSGAPPVIGPASSRIEQFAQIQRQIRTLARRRTLVMLIEDVHWAGSDTLALLETIASSARLMRLLVVVTQRTGEPEEDSPAFKTLVRLHRLPQTTHLILDRLSDPVIGQLLYEAADGIGSDAQREIVRLCEGNPFFAEELLRTAALHGRSDTVSRKLPFAIGSLVRERFHRLDPREREVLAKAAVIGRRFSMKLLESIEDLPRRAIHSALRRARDEHILVEEGPNEFSFVHALTREAIYSTLLESEAQDIHRRVASALEEMNRDNCLDHALAYHWWAARDPDKSFFYGVRAGDEAMAVYAYEDAARAYSYALSYADRTSARAAQPLLDMGKCYGRVGLKQLTFEPIEQARVAFRGAGDLTGECDACIELSAVMFSLGVPDCAQPVLDVRTRLNDPESTSLAIRCDVFLAQLHILRGEFSRGAAMLEGITVNPKTDDPKTAGLYYALQGGLAAREGDVNRYRDLMRLGIRCGFEGGLINEPSVILSNLASGLTQLGYLEEAKRSIEECEEVVQRHNLQFISRFVHATSIMYHVLLGNLSEARQLIEEEVRTPIEAADLQALIGGWGLTLGLILEDATMIERHFAPELQRTMPAHLAAATAERLRQLGRAEEADTIIAKAFEQGEGARTLFTLYLAAARSDDRALQAKVREQLVKCAALPQDRVCRAALPLFDAIVAAGSGDALESAERASLAAEHFKDLRFLFWEAQALELAGRADDALAIYRRIGVKSRVRGAALGRDVRKTPVATHYAGTLSPRETEVARLVAGGATNAEVAATMSISVKAVEKHLSSIYGKLEIPSRAKLAAEFRGYELESPSLFQA
jgi:DNA-binding CsgD family transcriptional regulator